MTKIDENEKNSKEKCSFRRTTNTINDNYVHKVEEAVPPNGGYGWVIVFAAFMCAVIIYGILYSFGIFLAYFVDYYSTSKSEIAWIGSVFSGCLFLVGPLSGALTNRFGSRIVIAVGSIISTLAFLSSTTVSNTRLLTFTYGILGGIGFGLINVAMLVSVSYYFSTKRAFATGILMCGGSLGNFAVPQLINFLLKIYDWKGAMIILSGLALNCMVFGFLMRPLTLDSRNKRSHVDKSTQSGEHISKANKKSVKNKPIYEVATQENLLCNVYFKDSEVTSHKETNKQVFVLPERRFCYPDKSKVCEADIVHITPESFSKQLPSILCFSQFLNKTSIQAKKSPLQNLKARTFNDVTNKCRDRVSMQQIQRRFSLPAVKALCLTTQAISVLCANVEGGNLESARHAAAVNSRLIERPADSKSIFFSDNNSTNNLEIQNSQIQNVGEVLSQDVHSTLQSQYETRPATSKRFIFLRNMVDSLTETLDLSLLKEMHFLLTCIAYIVGTMGFYIPFVFLPHMSNTKGIDREKSSLSISILAIANFAGSCGIGYIADRQKVQPLNLTVLCVCISAAACFAFPFCYGFQAIASVSIAYGFFIAPKICLISIILVDMLGLNKIASAFGLISLFRGVGCLIGSPIAGAIYDATGSYDIPFYMAGTCLLLSAGMMTLASWITYQQKGQYTIERTTAKETTERTTKQNFILSLNCD